MPELPEVENVKLGLLQVGVVGQEIKSVELRSPSLRTPLSKKLSRDLKGQILKGLSRRAKYLLFETEYHILLSHLGMTGSWRVYAANEEIKHDHVILHLSSVSLVYNDPRRFGILEHLPKKALSTNRWLKSLGVEPLEEDFTEEYLFKNTRGIKAPIKNFIMDQRRVVGVGNIYASEALFKSGIRPTRPAGRLKREESLRLRSSIQDILRRAIDSGGSTIRDYKNTHGESGSFQTSHQVYDRALEPCLKCNSLIRSKFITGRNTYWCVKCQR